MRFAARAAPAGSGTPAGSSSPTAGRVPRAPRRSAAGTQAAPRGQVAVRGCHRAPGTSREAATRAASLGKGSLGLKKRFLIPSIARNFEPHNWQAAKLRSVGGALGGLRSAAAALCFQLETWPELRKRYLHRRRAEQRRHEVSEAQKGKAPSEHTSLKGPRKGQGKGRTAKGHRKGHGKGWTRHGTFFSALAAMEECRASCGNAARRGEAHFYGGVTCTAS